MKSAMRREMSPTAPRATPIPIPALVPELNPPPEETGTAVLDGVAPEVLGEVFDASAAVFVEDEVLAVVVEAATLAELVDERLGKINPLICTAHTIDELGTSKVVVVNGPTLLLAWT
jgi:hypothetical protein